MTWVYLDDKFPSHPKVELAGDLAGWLFVCGLAYCKSHGTAGLIPKAAVQKLIQSPATKPTRALLAVGLWEDDGDYFLVHDWLRWNQTSEAKRAAAQKAANARWGNANAMPAHSDTDARGDAQTCPIPQSPSIKAFPSSIEEAHPQVVDKQGLDEGGVRIASARSTPVATGLLNGSLVAPSGSSLNARSAL